MHPFQPRGIRIDGEDAERFLQAQLTLDVRALGAGVLQPAGWCDSHGRVIVTGLLARGEPGFLLVVPNALRDQTMARIDRYRIGWKIRHQPADVQPAGTDDEDALSLSYASERAMKPATGEITELDEATVTDLLAADAIAGMPWLAPETQGRFLPQMLGLEALGALSYRKGCYPGQEVIARVRYRGRITRKLQRYRSIGGPPLPPGHEARAGSTRFTVLYAAPAEGGQVGLAVVRVEPSEADEPGTADQSAADRFEWF
ncbi:MAG: hypothetical protein Kow0020_00980 [Wenzhouxiangellaceae bacterium]